MGVKRMETRLITEYLGARKEIIELKQAYLKTNPIVVGVPFDYEAKLDGQMLEINKLFDILGGFNDA